MAKQLRGPIVDAACELSLEFGWSAVTMARLADRVGISRQTIYNEVGGKAQLARLVVYAANDRLVALLSQTFDEAPGQAPGDVRAGVLRLVVAIAADPLLAALVAGLHGADPAALPMVEAEAPVLLADLSDALADALARNLCAASLDVVEGDLTEAELSIASSALVRLVLCAAVQPGSPPAQAADDLAWVADRLVRPGRSIQPIG